MSDIHVKLINEENQQVKDFLTPYDKIANIDVIIFNAKCFMKRFVGVEVIYKQVQVMHLER